MLELKRKKIVVLNADQTGLVAGGSGETASTCDACDTGATYASTGCPPDTYTCFTSDCTFTTENCSNTFSSDCFSAVVCS